MLLILGMQRDGCCPDTDIFYTSMRMRCAMSAAILAINLTGTGQCIRVTSQLRLYSMDLTLRLAVTVNTNLMRPSAGFFLEFQNRNTTIARQGRVAVVLLMALRMIILP